MPKVKRKTTKKKLKSTVKNMVDAKPNNIEEVEEDFFPEFTSIDLKVPVDQPKQEIKIILTDNDDQNNIDDTEKVEINEKPSPKSEDLMQIDKDEKPEDETIMNGIDETPSIKSPKTVEEIIYKSLEDYFNKKSEELKKIDETKPQNINNLDDVLLYFDKLRLKTFGTPFEPIYSSSILNQLQVSLVIKLYNEYFTLEAPKMQRLEPPKLQYNKATKGFLREIVRCRLVPDILEQIRGIECIYYEGCIVIELIDLRTNITTTRAKQEHSKFVYRLLLRPEPEALHHDIDHFVDERYPDLDDESRLRVFQKVLLATKRDICLTPDPIVCKVENILQYNRQKFNFRRRKRRKYTQGRNNANVEHPLLNYIIYYGWLTAERTLPPIKKEEIKQKKDFKLPKEMMNPLTFLQQTHKICINNKPPNRARILQFQATHDKNRIWKVDIIPILNGQQYECILSPAHEHSSRWTIGSKHATDLYVQRLKDMFTSNGKTKCIMDRETDMQNYTLHFRQHGFVQGAHGLMRPTQINPQMSLGRVPQQPTQIPQVRQQSTPTPVTQGVPTAVPTHGTIPTGYPYRQPAMTHIPHNIQMNPNAPRMPPGTQPIARFGQMYPNMPFNVPVAPGTTRIPIQNFPNYKKQINPNNQQT